MNINNKFATRQVHLDFHTSPAISGIGSRFSKENFQRALKLGNLDSITVFAKCHHGYCYYPTKVGNQHPGLDFDLTGAMIDAAHIFTQPYFGISSNSLDNICPYAATTNTSALYSRNFKTASSFLTLCG